MEAWKVTSLEANTPDPYSSHSTLFLSLPHTLPPPYHSLAQLSSWLLFSLTAHPSLCLSSGYPSSSSFCPSSSFFPGPRAPRKSHVFPKWTGWEIEAGLLCLSSHSSVTLLLLPSGGPGKLVTAATTLQHTCPFFPCVHVHTHKHTHRLTHTHSLAPWPV